MKPETVLAEIAAKGNLRNIPEDTTGREHLYLDFSTNDYLGLATDNCIRVEFLREAADDESMFLSSSASRLLAATQKHHTGLEQCLQRMYGNDRDVLLFNSGYHANSGILAAIADKSTLIVADKLVHASLIDGIMLSRCDFRRFPHNDLDALERIIRSNRDKYSTFIVIVESVYSMDGDRADLERLLEIKKAYEGIILYLDEAHAFGVEGPDGLGLAQGSSSPGSWDIVVGTFGKAAASMGAFAVMSPLLKKLLVNRCRSLIFSTALPPLQMAWTHRIVEMLPSLESRRIHLRHLSARLADVLSPLCPDKQEASHIQPLITGDAAKAVELSKRLLEENIKVLAIRTPTVPAGTERLRFSLSAAMTDEDIDSLNRALKSVFA